MKHPIVLGITGASGAVYTTRLLEVLVATGFDVHLTISPSGQAVLKQELDIAVDLNKFRQSHLMPDRDKNTLDKNVNVTPPLTYVSDEKGNVQPRANCKPGQVIYHHFHNFMSPIASGSFLTAGMIVCPCSGSTLSAIANAAGNNLIHRAANVHLKERRPLVLVPRETPLSLLQLENMARASQGGAIVLPAMPGWYHGVTTLQDLIDFIVARILDQLGIEHTLMRRWGDPQDPHPTTTPG